MGPKIGFRDLEEPDLPPLVRWLNLPHVAEWYGTDEGDDSSEEGVRAKYLPYIEGDPRTSHFIFLIDDEPSGLIQWYRVDDYPEYSKALQVEPGGIAIDLFIGWPRLIHRGIGPRVIGKFLKEEAFPNSGAEVCYIGPAMPNEAAKKAYTKVGFQFLKSVHVPGERYPESIMRLYRSELSPVAE